jgi:dsDNA-binding SOS-regulon protein
MSPSKYRAVRTEVDGITFASKAEARRYSELKLLEKAGEVKELELQPKFPLYAPTRSKQEQVTTYVADFRYRRGPKGILVIEDVKGMKTPVYRLKKKWFEAQYGLLITEVLR